MKLTVDRIDDKYAVCEMPDGSMKNILLTDLPYGVKEGSVVEIGEETSALLEDEEREKRKRNFEKMTKLFSKNHLQ